MTIINDKTPTDLRKGDFYYNLPEELIAQTPLKKRDTSRLMVLDRSRENVRHMHFYDIVDLLLPSDVLVINDSKVIPARLYGLKEGIPGADVELLLLKNHGLEVWETLVKPGKRARVGDRIIFSEGRLSCLVESITKEGNRLVKFDFDRTKYQSIYDILHEIGLMPLPPYITEKLEDSSRYQTVYAKEQGSAAAPTAGLHFTEELLEKIRAKGVAIAPVMLHVGLGTFRPVKEDRITEHVMHSEYFSVPESSASLINERKRAGGRVVCVGTTSCRTLESASGGDGMVRAISGETGIFIYPGYKFKVMDALITNFHLPESTLLMLVSAFYGRDRTLAAYEEAVKERYRFFSFGDAMFIS